MTTAYATDQARSPSVRRASAPPPAGPLGVRSTASWSTATTSATAPRRPRAHGGCRTVLGDEHGWAEGPVLGAGLPRRPGGPGRGRGPARGRRPVDRLEETLDALAAAVDDPPGHRPAAPTDRRTAVKRHARHARHARRLERRPDRRCGRRRVPRRGPRDRPEPRRVDSLVLVSTGHGKGKSTSAFGTVLRAVARDWRVLVVQFMKSGKWHVGEEAVCRRLGVEWWTIGDGFTWESDDLDRSAAIARRGLAGRRGGAGRRGVRHGRPRRGDLPAHLRLGGGRARLRRHPGPGRRTPTSICTGRDATDELVDLADTVTEMRMVKHAYASGRAGQAWHRLLTPAPRAGDLALLR